MIGKQEQALIDHMYDKLELVEKSGDPGSRCRGNYRRPYTHGFRKYKHLATGIVSAWLEDRRGVVEFFVSCEKPGSVF